MNIQQQIHNAISNNQFQFSLPIPHYERSLTINNGLLYIDSLQITNELKHNLRSRLNGCKYFF